MALQIYLMSGLIEESGFMSASALETKDKVSYIM